MKTLFFAAALAALAVGCGSEDKKETTTPTTTTLSFETDIRPLLTANCVATGCHNASGPDSGAKNYLTITEAVFKASTAKSDITTKRMPKADSSQATSMSQADKDKILAFLAQ